MSIDSISGQFQAGFLSGAQQSSSVASGIFMGHAVRQVETPESLLASAAEELTFAADTTDEFELQERKERNKASRAQDDRVRMYQELMHQAGKSEQLNNLKDSLRAQQDARRALDKAREFFPDPSDAWAALIELAEELKASGGEKALVRELEEAISGLEEREGPAIRAGVQGALAASGFPELGSSDDMRDFYRQTVCEFSTVNEVFAHIQQTYGGDFEAAMDFLFSALSADIGSDMPSMGVSHLESVHGNLGKVRLTQSAYRLCEEMLGRWENVHGMPGAGGMTAMGLLGDIVALREVRFLGSMQIEGILAKAHAPDIEKEVLFLQELLMTTRKFPVVLFDDDQGRLKVLDAVQEAVDKAVERDDEWLAQQEG
jgi:type III secretion protein W